MSGLVRARAWFAHSGLIRTNTMRDYLNANDGTSLGAAALTTLRLQISVWVEL